MKHLLRQTDRASVATWLAFALFVSAAALPVSCSDDTPGEGHEDSGDNAGTSGSAGQAQGGEAGAAGGSGEAGASGSSGAGGSAGQAGAAGSSGAAGSAGAAGQAGAAGSSGQAGAAGSSGAAGSAGAAGQAGAAGSSGAAGSAGYANFWEGDYDPNGAPPLVPGGGHNAGKMCLSCHTGMNSFRFGGTIYKKDGVTPAPHVQVGVRYQGKLYTTYSADNGNIWLWGTTEPSWITLKTEVRIRNSAGEQRMMTYGDPDCNSCHGEGMRIIEPHTP